MAGDTMRFRNPAGHAGLLNNLLGLVNALVNFFESRFSLVAKESKTALVQVIVLVGCLAGAALLVAFGFVFLMVSAIIGLAHALQISWIWIALAAAGLHFLLAIICVVIARMQMKKPMFESTAIELKRDREWLKNLDKKSPSTN